MFQQLPTAGLPFQFERWEEFEAFVHDQVVTGVIEELTEIRWDVRPAVTHGTLENRVCDGVSTLPRWARWSRSCTAWSCGSTSVRRR